MNNKFSSAESVNDTANADTQLQINLRLVTIHGK